MSTKFSGYLSIYNDWDVLEPALKSMAGIIDELVVVDGAYAWMTRFLEKTGRNPFRSDDRVFDAIEASGIPYRVISQPWKNEPEKRMAGYEACANRYVFRIDADEVSFFTSGELDNFLSVDGAVAEMELPIYTAPGWIRVKEGRERLERQSFLFDREKISTEIHLNYLWLVLGADALPQPEKRPFQVHPEPIAFNAHLTSWRSPDSSINRAAFYSLNYIRGRGVPWLPALRDKPVEDFEQFFELVPPEVYLQTLLSSRIVGGAGELGDGWYLKPTPLSAEQESSFVPCFEALLSGLASLNQQLSDSPRQNPNGLRVTLDISSVAAVAALSPDGLVVIEVSDEIHAARVDVLTLLTETPWQTSLEIRHLQVGKYLMFRIPELGAESGKVLRRTIEFSVWTKSASQLHGFSIYADRPLPFSVPEEI